MENAGEALKMAAAMLIFVGALSIAIFVLSRARQTSAAIMDKKEAARTYYHIDNLESERIVNVDTVITNLYNYYQSQSTILFYNADTMNDAKSGRVEPVPLYNTEAKHENEMDTRQESNLNKAKLSIGNMNDSNDENEKRKIFGIDTHDELIRQEPWSRNDVTAKQFIDALVNRQETPGYDISRYSGSIYSFSQESPGRGESNVFKPMRLDTDPISRRRRYHYQLFYNFTYDFDGEKTSLIDLDEAIFVERIGIYNYEAFYDRETDDEGKVINMTFNSVTGDNSRIWFEDFDGEDLEESIENKDGEKKTVIEYIYIKNPD